MCGYNFLYSTDSNSELDKVVQVMNNHIEWRGPDGQGVLHIPERNLAFGHVRLAIQDTSEHGAQPFSNGQRRFYLVFNGEIYNHFELRAKYLDDTEFSGTSDTETLFYMLIVYGISKTLPLLEGMFSFVFYDTESNTINVARDAFGEKPLYYGINECKFFITSDLNAVKCKSEFSFNIDRNALSSYFRFNYVPAPHSIFEGVKKLTAGTYFTLCLDEHALSIDNILSAINLNIKTHYSKPEHVESYKDSYSEAVTKLDEIVNNAVASRMISDVPLGSFLSGGVDSSLVSALCQSNSTQKVDTFSLGFDDPSCDESVHAKKVAKHIGSNHNEIIVNEQTLLNVIPNLPTMFSEPFADSSQLPTFLVSQFARKKVTVCLSGDAGDELFCGYNRYFYTQKIMGQFASKPKFIKDLLAKILINLPLDAIEKFYNFIRQSLPQRMNVTMLATKLRKAAEVLKVEGYSDFFLRTLSHSKVPEQLVIDGVEYKTSAHVVSEQEFLKYGIENSMMRLDMEMYLSDDILTKVDRASMFSSLEARVPLLDKELVSFAASIPLSFKTDGSKGKLILRDVLYNYVPKELIERPKQGFAIPLKRWLSFELLEWAEELLTEEKLSESGVLNVQNVRRLWQKHKLGIESNEYLIWDVLMFQAWFDNWKGSSLMRPN